MSPSDRFAERLLEKIRNVPDFPKPGILFRDITPLLQDPQTLKLACEAMTDPFRDSDVDLVVGVESRGFIFGPPVAIALNAGFAITRKAGKLPWETVQETYDLEYGKEQVEMHRDAIQPGQRVLLIDDVIATGGTAAATASLVTHMGGEVVGGSFLIELSGLDGRSRLPKLDLRSVLVF
ncbi:MAG: adenine phosphoribosyltransferase [Myxococcota bacterium]